MAKKPAPGTLPTYDQHPIAQQLMPGGMSPEDFDAFCDDIESRGVIFPIMLYEGKVLDGWHRYRACHKTGTRFRTEEYTGNDPAGFVAACNVLRRKLSSLQKTLVGARLHLEHAMPQAMVCKRLAISNTTLTMVLKAIDMRLTNIIRRIENDSEYTRGMLRDELEEAGLVHKNYGRSADPSKIANSVFDMGRVATEGKADPEESGTSDGAAERAGEFWANLPDKGKKPAHTERRAKDTAPQRMQNAWKELMRDEKVTFLQMIWPEARKLAEEALLPGLTTTAKAKPVADKVIAKASKPKKAKA